VAASRTVREYLTAVHDFLIQRDGAIADDGEAARYLRWAKDQADRMDPLSTVYGTTMI